MTLWCLSLLKLYNISNVDKPFVTYSQSKHWGETQQDNSCFSFPATIYLIKVNNRSRGESRTAATSKMKRFVIIVNGWKPLTIITKRSILDVPADLDQPLRSNRKRCEIYLKLIIKTPERRQ